MIDDFLVISSPFSPIDSFSKYFDQKLLVQKVKRGLTFESNKSFFLSVSTRLENDRSESFHETERRHDSKRKDYFVENRKSPSLLYPTFPR